MCLPSLRHFDSFLPGRSLLFTCVALLFFAKAVAQNAISPIPSARLNYTQILFNADGVKQAVRYTLILKEADAKAAFSATSKVIKRIDSVPVFLVKNLNWGKAYRWSYAAIDIKGAVIFQSKEQNFSIQKKEELFNSPFIFKVKNPGHLGGYITWDGPRCLTDRNGDVQWIIPRSMRQNGHFLWDDIRDLRLTKSGSFTCVFMSGDCAEFDRDGEVIWLGPNDAKVSGDTSEHYHHEFLKLPNGHYLVLGETHGKFSLPENLSISKYAAVEGLSVENGKLMNSNAFSNLIEYDAAGKLVWYWRSRPYFEKLYKKGFPPGPTHLNAFCQDEAGLNFYLSFRDLDEILKLNKASKEIVATYGRPVFDSFNAYASNPLFAKQHSVGLLPNGDLITFNNGSETATTSTVIAFTPGSTFNIDPSKKSFEFSCKIDSLNKGKSDKLGNVDVLPSGRLFIGMGMLGRAVEISMDSSKILWDARCLKDKDSNPVECYRNHFFESMYPYVFKVLNMGDGIRIFNRGDLADSYAIRLMDKNNNLQSVINTGEVLPGADVVQTNLPLADHIVVQSINNSDASQTIFGLN